jgi:outer membrane protein
MSMTMLPAQALSLTEALSLARRTDPQYLAVKANLSASRERADQAFGALMPQVSATANSNSNGRNYAVRDAHIPEANDRYNGNGTQLNVSQPLWRRSNWIAVSQTGAAVAQADHQVKAAEQDLLLRLAQAWFDLMLARDVVGYTAAQVASTQHQWDLSLAGTELGVSSVLAIEEARSKFEQASADYASAESDQGIKLAVLEQIIGPLPLLTPPFLSEEYVAKDPRGATLDQWLADAEAHNPTIPAAVKALDAANDEIRKQRAGHEPTVDLVASYGRNSQGVGGFPGQSGYDIKQRSVGLQLNIPLFSGGTQNAKVGEALAMRDKAAQDLELARRNVRTATKQAWLNWRAGFVRQTAASQSLKFTAMTLQAALRGKANGLKMELDVLQARQQWYGTLRDLQKARYDMITSHIKLQAAAGNLTDADLTGFDAWFINNNDNAVAHALRPAAGAGMAR